MSALRSAIARVSPPFRGKLSALVFSGKICKYCVCPWRVFLDRRAISDASAGKDFHKCKRAMVITNSTLTGSAKKFAAEIQCAVVERTKLLEWIAKFKQETKRPSEGPKN
jgi:hypothetical protein